MYLGLELGLGSGLRLKIKETSGHKRSGGTKCIEAKLGVGVEYGEER